MSFCVYSFECANRYSIVAKSGIKFLTGAKFVVVDFIQKANIKS